MFRRRRLIASGGASRSVWTPASLFDAGQQGAYYRAATGVFEDTSAVTPSVADAVAGRINDLSPNGLNMLQATGAAKPLRKTDGTYWWLETDATDDFMATAATISLGPVPVYIACAFEKAAENGSSIFGCVKTSTDHYKIANLASSSRVQGLSRIASLGIAQSAPTTAVSSVPINTKTVAILRVVAGTTGITINALSEVTAANALTGAESVANAAITLCAGAPTVVTALAMKFYAGIVIEKNLSAAEIALLKTSLGAEMGVTL